MPTATYPLSSADADPKSKLGRLKAAADEARREPDALRAELQQLEARLAASIALVQEATPASDMHEVAAAQAAILVLQRAAVKLRHTLDGAQGRANAAAAPHLRAERTYRELRRELLQAEEQGHTQDAATLRAEVLDFVRPV